jgi:glycosyltransferase involved in cell wall biosynthesis
MPQLRTTVIPHGPYFYPDWPEARRKTREEFGIPMNAPVLLSFGHLRNNKNLMLVMEALRDFPEVHLLVVGSEAAPGQTTAEQYRAHAAELGVGGQMHWAIRYVGDDEVRRFFDAADYAIMTYSRTFRSTSGILHITAPLRMPVLVSCGDAPLGKMVEDFRLGYRVAPDSVEEIKAGIKRLLAGGFVGDWDAFNGQFTYEENARIVRERMFEKI